MSDHNPLTCKDDDHDDCFYAQMSQANRREIGRRRFDGDSEGNCLNCLLRKRDHMLDTSCPDEDGCAPGTHPPDEPCRLCDPSLSEEEHARLSGLWLAARNNLEVAKAPDGA